MSFIGKLHINSPITGQLHVWGTDMIIIALADFLAPNGT